VSGKNGMTQSSKRLQLRSLCSLPGLCPLLYHDKIAYVRHFILIFVLWEPSEIFSFRPYLDPLAPGTTSLAPQPSQVAHQAWPITLRLILKTSAYVNFSFPVRFASRTEFLWVTDVEKWLRYHGKDVHMDSCSQTAIKHTSVCLVSRLPECCERP